MEGRKAELEQQMLQAWKVMEMAQVRTKALSEGAVREAESALRVAEAAYRFGERGILDVLDAQRCCARCAPICLKPVTSCNPPGLNWIFWLVAMRSLPRFELSKSRPRFRIF
jgi:hypothetical protein